MNLGIFLSPGDSLKNMAKSGQDDRFINLYLKRYSKEFKKVFLFSYDDEEQVLYNNVYVIPNKTKIHRLLYGVLLPIINKEKVKDCNAIRGFGIASAISSFFLTKPSIFNWAYDYIEFCKVEKKYKYIPFYYLLEKLAFYLATKVFVATKEKLQSLKSEKYIYLPNGVEISKLKIKSKYNGGKLLYVGRFEKQKNLQLLIEAISLLPQKMKSITFIGSGSLENTLISYAKNHLVALKIIKPISHIKLLNVLKEYDILILTSFHEGSPKILLEAMALGLVPIVTNFPTAKEVIKNNDDGLITHFNSNDIAKKILELISDVKKYRRISKNSSNKIKKTFDLEKVLDKEIYELKTI